MRKVGIIDIGSNTIKALIAGGPHPLITEAIQVEECRISRDFSSEEKSFSDETLAEAADAISRLVDFSKQEGVENVIAVATSAVRDSENSEEFLNIIEERSGLQIRVLQGIEEAKLVADAILSDPNLDSSKPILHFDLGGGSLEFNLIEDQLVRDSISLPLGAVRLTQMWVAEPRKPYPMNSVVDISAHVKEVLAPHIKNTSEPPALVITGGAAFLAQKIMKTLPEFSETGQTVPLRFLLKLDNELLESDFDERIKIFNISPNRADVFPTAVQVLISILDVYHFEQFQYSNYGLRHGVARAFFDGQFS